jgi:hypothetical protein
MLDKNQENCIYAIKIDPEIPANSIKLRYQIGINLILV